LRVAISFFLSLCICHVPLFTQLSPRSASQSPQRDPQAVTALQNTLAVLGGSAIGQVQNSVAQGAMQPAPGSWLAGGNFTWETSGTEFRYDNPASGGTRSVLVSGSGKPKLSQSGTVSSVYAHV